MYYYKVKGVKITIGDVSLVQHYIQHSTCASCIWFIEKESVANWKYKQMTVMYKSKEIIFFSYRKFLCTIYVLLLLHRKKNNSMYSNYSIYFTVLYCTVINTYHGNIICAYLEKREMGYWWWCFIKQLSLLLCIYDW